MPSTGSAGRSDGVRIESAAASTVISPFPTGQVARHSPLAPPLITLDFMHGTNLHHFQRQTRENVQANAYHSTNQD